MRLKLDPKDSRTTGKSAEKAKKKKKKHGACLAEMTLGLLKRMYGICTSHLHYYQKICMHVQNKLNLISRA